MNQPNGSVQKPDCELRLIACTIFPLTQGND